MCYRSVAVLSIYQFCNWINQFSNKAFCMISIWKQGKETSKKNKGWRRKNIDIIH